MSQLAAAQVRTETNLNLLTQEMREFKDEMSEFKDEMSEFKNNTERYRAEAEADRKRMNKTWGDLANKLGTVVEDIVAPNIRRLALDEFGFSRIDDYFVRPCRRSRRGEDRQREFDVVCSGLGRVVVAEVKSSPALEDIAKFAEKLAVFFDFFPEYEGGTLIGVFASWALSPGLCARISAAGLYGVGMGDETMGIVARPAGG